jgi:hypothetical protein
MLNFPTAPNPATLFISGAGDLYIGTYAAAGADSAALRHMGPTSGGIAIEYKRDMHPVECDQFLGAVAAFPTKEACTIKVTLQDMTLANFYKALNMSVNTLTAGDRTDNSGSMGLGEETAQLYFQVVWKGKAPAQSSATSRIWQLYKCFTVTAGEVKNEKTKEAGVQVTLQALTDPTVTTANKVGKIIDA